MVQANIAYVVKWNYAVGISDMAEYAAVSLDESRNPQIVDFQKGSEALRDQSIPGLAGKVVRYFRASHNGEPRYSISLNPEGIIPEFVPFRDGSIGDVTSFIPLRPQQKVEFVYYLQEMIKLSDELILEAVKREIARPKD